MSNQLTVEYISILYKINDLYLRYKINDTDLVDEIEYYKAKDNISDDEIKDLQNMCINEWIKVINLLCEKLIKKIESKEIYKKILSNELKTVKKIKNEITNHKKKIDEYETIFDEKIIELKDSVEKNISIHKYNNKQRNKGYLFNIIIAVLFFFIGKYFQ